MPSVTIQGQKRVDRFNTHKRKRYAESGKDLNTDQTFAKLLKGVKA